MTTANRIFMTALFAKREKALFDSSLSGMTTADCLAPRRTRECIRRFTTT
jgi:hypothetical protein